MYLIPIDNKESNNSRFLNEPECLEVLDVFVNHYIKVGFNLPWIAYFVADENHNIVGGGGFKGKPLHGNVEISYGTFKKHQGKGIGTEICRLLILLAFKTDPSIKISAKTLAHNIPSMAILKKNGFICMGEIYDEEDGEVLLWEYNHPLLKTDNE
jgi:[ribosomal protein S5]-alanine N-acetyltransferase